MNLRYNFQKIFTGFSPQILELLTITPFDSSSNGSALQCINLSINTNLLKSTKDWRKMPKDSNTNEK